MKGMLKRTLAVACVLVLLLGLTPFSARAATYSDTSGHWAETAIERWSALGVLQGAHGKFAPDAPITRGQMATILDRVMKYQTAGTTVFPDISPSDYYYGAVLKANYAGVMLGSNGRAYPENQITRQDAAVMMARAFKLDFTEGGQTTFSDDASIASYAKGACQKMQQIGYLQGNQGRFDPLAPLTRAQAVTVLDRIVRGMAAAAGTVSQNVVGNLLINAPGVTVGAVTVTGDVYVAPGVANGEVTFNGTKITGRVFVMGGGSGSVNFTNGADCARLDVMRIDGPVRISAGAGVTLGIVNILGGVDQVILSGTARTVNQTVSGPRLTLASAQVTTLNMTVANASLDADVNSRIAELNTASAAQNAAVTNRGQITRWNLAAMGVTISNTGTLDDVRLTGTPKQFANSGTIRSLVCGVGAEITGTGRIYSAETAAGVTLSVQTQPDETKLGTSSTLVVAGVGYTNSTGAAATLVPPNSTGSNTSPAIKSVALGADKRTITITFYGNVVNNKATLAALRGAISLTTNGTNYTALGSDDEVAVVGNTLVVVLKNRLSGAQNRLRIDGGTLADAGSRVQQLMMITSSLDAGAAPAGFTVLEYSPKPGDKSVPLRAEFRLTFTKRVQKVSSVTKYISLYRSNGSYVEGIAVNSSAVVVSGDTVSFSFPSAMVDGYSYYILIDSGAFESSDREEYAGIVSSATWSFTASNAGLHVNTYSPQNGTTNAPVNSQLVLTFNQRIQKPVNNKYITLYRSNGTEIERINTSSSITSSQVAIGGANGDTATITLSRPLVDGYSYYVHIDAGAFVAYYGSETYAGISVNTTWTFTAGSSGLQVTQYSPASGAVNVPLEAELKLTFNKRVAKPTSGSYSVYLYRAGVSQPVETFNVRTSNKVSITGTGQDTVVITPTNPFVDGADYYVRIDSGAFVSYSDSDIYAGISANATWAFKTSGLSVTGMTPVNGATNVAATQDLTLTFNQRPVAMSGKYITIYDSTGRQFQRIAATSENVLINTGSYVVTIKHNAFAAGTVYYVMVDSGAFTAYNGGNAYAGISTNSVWRFTVGGGSIVSLANTTPLTISSANNATASFTVNTTGLPTGTALNLTIAAAGTGVTLSQTSVTTNASGVATGTVRSNGNLLAGKYTVTAAYGSASKTADFYVTGGTFTLALIPAGKTTLTNNNDTVTLTVTPVRIAAGQTVTVAGTRGLAVTPASTAVPASGNISVTVTAPAAALVGASTVTVTGENFATNATQSFTVSAPTTSITISQQPTGGTTTVGGTPITLTVTAAATPPGALTYQWYKNTLEISGATSASYIVPVDVASDAQYYVVIRSGAASATSNTVQVKVEVPVPIDITSIGWPSDTLAVNFGTSAEDMLELLPATVKGNGTVDLTVNWNTSGYDPNTAGNYMITGTVTVPGGYQLAGGVSAQFTVTVTVEP